MAEMIDIAKRRGLARVDAKNIVDIYFERIRFAKLHRLEPLLNFRTFNDAINFVLQIYSRAAHAMNDRDYGIQFESNCMNTKKNSVEDDYDSCYTEELLDSSSFIVPDKRMRK